MQSQDIIRGEQARDLHADLGFTTIEEVTYMLQRYEYDANAVFYHTRVCFLCRMCPLTCIRIGSLAIPIGSQVPTRLSHSIVASCPPV